MRPPSPSSVEALLDEKDKSSSRIFFSKPGRTSERLSRRRLFAICASLATVSLLGLVIFHLRAPLPTSRPAVDLPANVSNSTKPAFIPPEIIDPLHSSHFLRGPPTRKFRDNLLIEHNYLTSWISAGWTNDVITYANLVYLALITDRIPIIPLFNPSHIGGHVAPIPFGEVFDVPRLRSLLGRPVLEWREVKDPDHSDVEVLGCWNTWETVSKDPNARQSYVTHQLALDISYTQAPAWIKIIPNFEHDKDSTFWSLASLAFPETRKANLIPPRPSPQQNVSLPPDEHLVCYDYLYYVSSNQPSEYELDFSPAWRYAGQYFRWTSRLEDLGDRYVRKTMGIADDDELPTPPWITIHVRHRDFAGWCRGIPIEQCFATLPVIARRVQEVKDELLERKGIVINHVIMTSDEDNATWWQGVTDQGWLKVDHSMTVELYGGWYPLLIDAIIQSNGIGFVANDLSTVSVVARRRVESWHHGITRTVRWGTTDADDH